MHRPGRVLLSSVALCVPVLAGAAGTADASRSVEQTALTWGPCEEGVDAAFECATLAVPLDYRNPSGATIEVALIRLPADPAERQGAVLVNPGGPGASGYDYATNAGLGIAATMSGLDRFDIVGFDPRGVDRSGGIRCVDDSVLDAGLYPDDTPDDDAEELALDAFDVAFAAGCRGRYGDTLSLYSTENTARDMDLIRQALGDPQISFIGISYGTYLGGVYATLFPNQVRAMVLDSAFEPTGDSEYDQYITQLVGFEEAFDNWAAWCEESSECEFTAVDVAARWDTLIGQLDAEPIKSEQGRPVNQAVMERATKAALYSEDVWPALGAALADAARGDGTALLDIADNYNGRHDDGTFDTIHQSFRVIQCASGIDEDPPADPAALFAQMRAAAPRFTRALRPTDLRDWCRDLIAADIQPVVPSYSGAAPVVVVGGLNDPATPFRWAEELNAMMGPSARLVSFSGEGHGQILTSTCVTEIEAAAIAALQLPAPGTACEPDPPVERPSFWDQLPVPAGVGEPLSDPMIDLLLGLPDTAAYSDAWVLVGDVPSVVTAYTAAFEAAGFNVLGTDDTVIDGVTVIQTLSPDGTVVVAVLIPPDAIATNEDLADFENIAPPGQGIVVVAALAPL